MGKLIDKAATGRDDATLLKARELAQLLAVSSDMVYRLEANGTIPQAIKLGPRTFRWRRSEVQRWVSLHGSGKPRRKVKR